MVIGLLVSIAYTPVMLRLLGQSEYGLYNLVASVVAYLGILNFGFGSAYMRYYSKYKVIEEKEKIAKLNGMFLIIFSIMALIAVIAGTILAFNSGFIFGDKLNSAELYKSKIIMLILVANLAISFPDIVFTSHISANEKFIFQKILQMLKTIAHPFVVLPFLLMGYGSIGMVIATSFLNITIVALNVRYCLKKLKIRFIFYDFDLKFMKEITIFSSYIFINIVIDQINWNVDKFILGRFQGTVSVAVYALAAQLNNYYLSISTTISSVFIPRIHRLVAISNDNDTLTELFTRIGRIQFIMLSLISTGLIFFGRPFISIWAGANYNKSYPILILLIIPVTIPLIQNLGIEIQRAKNMHKFRSWLYLFIAVANVIISIPLAQKYGGFGAAAGTSISLIIGNGLIMNWYYHSRIGLNVLYFWKEILKFFPSLVIPAILGIIINLHTDLYNIYSFIIYSLIYGSVFCLSMWFLGLNTYEKDLIRVPFKRILSKNSIR